MALAVTTGALQPAHRSARPARRTLVNAEDPDKPMTLYDLPAEGEPWLNRYSSMLTRNKKQGASQAMLYATGLTQEDMPKPQVGVGSIGTTAIRATCIYWSSVLRYESRARTRAWSGIDSMRLVSQMVSPWVPQV